MGLAFGSFEDEYIGAVDLMKSPTDINTAAKSPGDITWDDIEMIERRIDRIKALVQSMKLQMKPISACGK